MSLTIRVVVFIAIALSALAAWHWSTAGDSAGDVTQLAVQQFQNDDAVPARLQQASLARSWWPFVLPALLAVVAVVMFWEDVERWWNRENA
jgi:hypothetical protein